MDVVAKNSISVGQSIFVTIDDLLPDLILVSYQHPNYKVYQGILLDSTKRRVPCGIYSKDLQKSVGEDGKNADILDDKLWSVSQRHTYNISGNPSNNYKKSKTNMQLNKKSSRMTVRLRPRQVLCSNCQSICNEKSENVGPVKSSVSKELCNVVSSHKNLNPSKNNLGLALREKKSTRDSRQMICTAEKTTQSSNTTVNSSPTQNAVLIPKLIKLKASDIETATSQGIKSKTEESFNVNCSKVQMLELENYVNRDKIPIVKLSSIKKGKIPKMTISTSNSGSSFGKCGIKTRSKGSIEEKILGLHASLSAKTVPKVILSSTAFQVEGHDKRTIESQTFTNWNTNLDQVTTSENIVNNNNKDFSTVNNNLVVSSIPTTVSESLPPISIPKVVTFLPVCLSTANSDNSDSSQKIDKMSLRKKRSVGSMEDLWDETVFDEAKKRKDDSSPECTVEFEANAENEKPKTTPILKISFGPGKGTVLKIPAKSTVSETDTNDVDIGEQREPPKEKLLISKAARKALKRARKEAQRKASFGLASSRMITGKARFSVKSSITLGAMSPARFSGLSPGRFGGVSPGRFSGGSPGRLSCSSPGRFGGASPARFAGSSFGTMLSPRTGKDCILWSQTRRHRHKVKHKKKHKEHKHKSSDENAEPNAFSVDVPFNKEIEPLTESTNVNLACSPGIDKTIENTWKVPNSPNQTTSPRQNLIQNTRHKLSISIKRVSNASYVACDPSAQSAEIHGDLKSYRNDAIILSDASDLDDKILEDREKSETYKPMGLNCNFLNISPERDAGSDHSQNSDDNLDVPNFPYIVSKITWPEDEAREQAFVDFKVGDIVWGKIHDYPWWPAKVTCVRLSEEICSSDPNYKQALVKWYGTNATTVIPAMTLRPFLKHFNVIFDKRKPGQYLKAVRLASCEAKQIVDNTEQMVANKCESPITTSPREVDVVS